MESYPYEPEERGSDYVRLASIAAGEWAPRPPTPHPPPTPPPRFPFSVWDPEPARLCPAERADPDVGLRLGVV